MRITCISDLHGFLPPKLPGGDLLVIAGDLTSHGDAVYEYFRVYDWIEKQKYTDKILVAGNHDMDLAGENGKILSQAVKRTEEFYYLKDSGVVVQNHLVWGTPRSLWFEGINPLCTAFTGSEKELARAFAKIPDNIEILISHGPAYGLLDLCRNGNVGSQAMRQTLDRVKPKLFICGHIHENGGKQLLYKHAGPNTLCVNAAYVDEFYKPAHEPITVEI